MQCLLVLILMRLAILPESQWIYRLHSTTKVFIHLWLSIAVDELLA